MVYGAGAAGEGGAAGGTAEAGRENNFWKSAADLGYALTKPAVGMSLDSLAFQ